MLCWTPLSAALEDPLLAEEKLGVIAEGLVLEWPERVNPNGKTEREISALVFSPDLERFAYVSYRGQRPVAVVGAEVFENFDYVEQPVFSDDSLHVAFRVEERISPKAERWHVLLDGKKIAAWDWIDSIAFVPDSDKLAYWSWPGARLDHDGIYAGGRKVLVFAGRKGDEWSDGDRTPVFSRDGRFAVTTVEQGSQWFVLKVGKKEEIVSEGFSMIGDVAISPDGKRVAFAVWQRQGPGPLEGKWRIHEGKQELGEKYEFAGFAQFTPDGSKLAYRFARGGKYGVVVGDKESSPARFEWISEVAFSKDSRQVAVVGNQGGKPDLQLVAMGLGHLAQVGGGRWVVQWKDWTSAKFDEIKNLCFRNDGKELAFCARTGVKWRVHPTASSGPECDAVGPPRFSRDGKTVRHGARLGREVWVKAVACEK